MTIVLHRILVESALDILYFPVWWYTAGTVRAAKWCWSLFNDGNSRLAPGLWVANIFVPMYGQYDWQGRLVSFFMRWTQVLMRSAALAVWGFFCLILFGVWLAIPAVIFFGLYRAVDGK